MKPKAIFSVIWAGFNRLSGEGGSRKAPKEGFGNGLGGAIQPFGLAGNCLTTYAKWPSGKWQSAYLYVKWRKRCPGQRPFSLKFALVLKSTVICLRNSNSSLTTVAWRWRTLFCPRAAFAAFSRHKTSLWLQPASPRLPPPHLNRSC